MLKLVDGIFELAIGRLKRTGSLIGVAGKVALLRSPVAVFEKSGLIFFQMLDQLLQKVHEGIELIGVQRC